MLRGDVVWGRRLQGRHVIPEKVQNGKVDVVGVANYAFYPSPELTSVVLLTAFFLLEPGLFKNARHWRPSILVQVLKV